MRIGEPLKPDRAFMKLYYAYLLIADAIIFLGVILPAVISAVVFLPLDQSLTVVASLILPFLLAVWFIAYWIPKYYLSTSYVFAESEIVVEKGVWWKHKSTVPYNRVTNIDVVQGPLSRRFGLGKIRVQTAGYSAAGGGAGAIAEAQIFGVKNFEEIRNFILDMVRGVKPVAVEAAVEAEAAVAKQAAQQMLDELRKIRDLLEHRDQSG